MSEAPPEVDPPGGADHLLVVDDSATQREKLASILRADGFTVRTVDSGQAALEAIEADPPMAVVTDLQMPNMDGCELVGRLRGTHPSLPVIVATAKGSEDIAAEALRCGAASYVPKRMAEANLSPVVRQVLTHTESARSVRELGRMIRRLSLTLDIPNDETLVPKVIARIEGILVELDLFDDGDRMQIAMALDEAINNAIAHGNLEVPSSLREVDGGSGYFKLIEERKRTPPYSERTASIGVDVGPEGAVFTVTDMGPGYDPDKLCDATDAEHIEGLGGRGMLMIDAFMDEVQLNDCGNEIRMTKRQAANG